MNLKYILLIYILLLIFIYFWKPNIFNLDKENKKKKIIYLFFLVIIIAIISFYMKVLSELFF